MIQQQSVNYELNIVRNLQYRIFKTWITKHDRKFFDHCVIPHQKYQREQPPARYARNASLF